MNHTNNSGDTQVSADSSMFTAQLHNSSEGLLPAFTTQHYTHLPTPQSPNSMGPYIHDQAHSPETPIQRRRIVAQKSSQIEETITRPPSTISQCITPETSPQLPYNPPADNLTPATPRYFVQHTSDDFTTPKNNSAKMQATITLLEDAEPSKRPSTSSPPPSDLPRQTSTLSSPFMAKLSLGDQQQAGLLSQFHDSLSHQMSISTPPMSPSQQNVDAQLVKAGGELERIRQRMEEDRLSQLREAESKRPEWLKRAKRPLSEVDSGYQDEDDDKGKTGSIGVLASPHKGRRLALFQATSEESFEESLMAGGYGRYRTADWVRQPQPMSLYQSGKSGEPGEPGSSTAVPVPEQDKAEAGPPTEKQLKKQKRLAAFCTEPQTPTKLMPVELEGKGRVLIDAPVEDRTVPASPEPSPSKKRVANRRKKKNNDATANKKGSADTTSRDETPMRPNWPDSEFPWRLRMEERREMAKAEEEERLRLIERFLDRDSDDEKDRDGVSEAVPGDPANAMSALLAKTNSRARNLLSRENLRCCGGLHDGDAVQCDACQQWFHLGCVGVTNAAELGAEEDPWFCDRCVTRNRSPSPEQTEEQLSNTPFFQPSFSTSSDWNIAMPKTPNKGRTIGKSPLSWLDSSRGPTTPQHGTARSVRIYNSMDDDAYNVESPWDPSSTPSRGIRFHHASPKDASRRHAYLHSPTRGPGRGVSASSMGNSPGHRMLSSSDYSDPSDRNHSFVHFYEPEMDHGMNLHHPWSRPSHSMLSYPDESPIMRSASKQRKS
ncbi:hypothetical protein CPC08DRAFT_489637 [Agrocybe pediades]|nr:hypothetical protein CPC08DRAFT_489637 [Agrocybe pediades]